MDKSTQLNISRPDRYKLGLARAKKLRRLAEKHGWDKDDDKMASYLIDEVSPYYLHLTMFGVCIREQGSDEQKKYWMTKIDKFQILGAYAQVSWSPCMAFSMRT
jgi:acyl-CoA oxidase